MPRKNRLNSQRNDALNFRNLSVRASTINAEERSVETVIATDAPVPMMDWERWEVVPEVLRADGAQWPEQIPFLDNHNRYTTSDQLGSARDIKREGGEIIGRLRFSSNADEQWNLVREGHITDVSAGYQVLDKTFVPRGTTQKVMGRDYTGPVNVVTKWKLREVSLTPIGADEQAKLRGFDSAAIPPKKGFEMNEQLRSLLESRGMPKDLSDDDAQRWMVDNIAKLNEPERKDPPAGAVTITDELRKLISEATTEAARKAVEEDRKQREQLRNIADTVLKIAGVERCAEINEKLDSCRTREEIESAVIDFKAARQSAGLSTGVNPPIFNGAAEYDKFEAGMRTALVERCLDSVSMPSDFGLEIDDKAAQRREAARNAVFPKEKHSEDASAFRNLGVYDMARTYVEQVYRVRSMDFTRDQIAVMALFGPQRAAEIFGLNIRDAGAYHTTGNFANLTLDAMNKSMLMGYTEAPSTWQNVMRTGADVPDFKNVHRMRLGTIPNIPVWPDNTEPKAMSIKDAKETYAVESRSASIDFSYRLLVNDDMNALSRVPGQFGQSFRRTLNAYAWSLVTSNPTMSDGVALFSGVTGNRKRSNLTTGAGAPSTTTIQTLTGLMMNMRGENTPEENESPDILALMPRYIVGPVALRTTIMQLVLSVYDNASNGSLAYNMAAGLTPVIEPLLDVNSTTAWYMFADPSQIDTVEISFLSGQRSPQTRQELDISTLSQRVYALQTFGGRPMNHRGMQKHNGA